MSLRLTGPETSEFMKICGKLRLIYMPNVSSPDAVMLANKIERSIEKLQKEIWDQLFSGDLELCHTKKHGNQATTTT